MGFKMMLLRKMMVMIFWPYAKWLDLLGCNKHIPASQLCCHTRTWTWKVTSQLCHTRTQTQKATGRVKWDDHSTSFLAFMGLGDESEFMNDDPSQVRMDSGSNLPWSVNNYF